MCGGTSLLVFQVSTLLWTAGNGAFISPIAYTLTDVESVNGSSANGGCPQECEGMAIGVRRCDSRQSIIGEETITGVVIDGMVPTIDSSIRGTWAAELYTVEITMTTFPIGFLFQSSVMLYEMELYVFYCPAWDIGAATISVYNGVSFPTLVRVGASAESVGSVTLTSDMQNCFGLTRVSIPLQMATSTSSYFIEFTNPTSTRELYIAEVRFSDQPIPPFTGPATTTAQTALDITTPLSTTPANMAASSSIPLPTTTNIPQTTTMNIITPTPSPDHTPTTSTTISTTASVLTSSPPSTSQASTIVTVLIMVIVVLVLVVMGGSVVMCVVCVMKTKSSRGVVGGMVRGDAGHDDRDYDSVQELSGLGEGIETKANEAYGHVSGGRGGGGGRGSMEMVRNEAYGTTTTERTEDDGEGDVTYEVVH